jgi:hypothetical protein
VNISYRNAAAFGVLAICVWAGARAAAQDRPLPDLGPFLREARKHLETDSSLQAGYMYQETRREQKLDKHGKVAEETVEVYENYPALPGEERWERLIEKNGRPLSAGDLEKQDRERRKKAEEAAERLAAETPADRARQKEEWEKQRREREKQIDDVWLVFDIRMIRRERIEGHDTIEIQLTPRPDPKPRTRAGGIMRHFTVRAWISESDHQLVRLNAEAIDAVSFGFGLLARLHKGAELSFLRRKVNGEVWLPAMVRYGGSARVGLLAVLRRSGLSEYSGYRKFSVDTSSTFNTSK